MMSATTTSASFSRSNGIATSFVEEHTPAARADSAAHSSPLGLQTRYVNKLSELAQRGWRGPSRGSYPKQSAAPTSVTALEGRRSMLPSPRPLRRPGPPPPTARRGARTEFSQQDVARQAVTRPRSPGPWELEAIDAWAGAAGSVSETVEGPVVVQAHLGRGSPASIAGA